MVAACDAAAKEPLDLVLLDPHRRPSSIRENFQNRQILEAFAQFRWHIELIRQDQLGVSDEIREVDVPDV